MSDRQARVISREEALNIVRQQQQAATALNNESRGCSVGETMPAPVSLPASSHDAALSPASHVLPTRQFCLLPAETEGVRDEDEMSSDSEHVTEAGDWFPAEDWSDDVAADGRSSWAATVDHANVFGSGRQHEEMGGTLSDGSLLHSHALKLPPGISITASDTSESSRGQQNCSVTGVSHHNTLMTGRSESGTINQQQQIGGLKLPRGVSLCRVDNTESDSVSAPTVTRLSTFTDPAENTLETSTLMDQSSSCGNDEIHHSSTVDLTGLSQMCRASHSGNVQPASCPPSVLSDIITSSSHKTEPGDTAQSDYDEHQNAGDKSNTPDDLDRKDDIGMGNMSERKSDNESCRKKSEVVGSMSHVSMQQGSFSGGSIASPGDERKYVHKHGSDDLMRGSLENVSLPPAKMESVDDKRVLVVSEDEKHCSDKKCSLDTAAAVATKCETVCGDIKLPAGISLLSTALSSSPPADVKRDVASSQSFSDPTSRLVHAGASVSHSTQRSQPISLQGSAHGVEELGGIRLPRGVHIENAEPLSHCLDRDSSLVSTVAADAVVDSQTAINDCFTTSSADVAARATSSLAHVSCDTTAGERMERVTVLMKRPAPRSARLARLARMSAAEAASSLAAVTGFDDGPQSSSTPTEDDEDQVDGEESDCDDSVDEHQGSMRVADEEHSAELRNHESDVKMADDNVACCNVINVSRDSVSPDSVGSQSHRETRAPADHSPHVLAPQHSPRDLQPPPASATSSESETCQTSRTMSLQEAKNLCEQDCNEQQADERNMSFIRDNRSSSQSYVHHHCDNNSSSLPVAGEHLSRTEVACEDGKNDDSSGADDTVHVLHEREQCHATASPFSEGLTDEDIQPGGHDSQQLASSATLHDTMSDVPVCGDTASDKIQLCGDQQQHVYPSRTYDAVLAGEVDDDAVGGCESMTNRPLTQHLPDELSCLIGDLDGQADTAAGQHEATDVVRHSSLDGTAEDLSEVKDMLDILDEKPGLLEAVSAASEHDGARADASSRASSSCDSAATGDSEAEKEQSGGQHDTKRRRKRRSKPTDQPSASGTRSDEESVPKRKRRNIRQIISEKKLDSETLKAQEQEKERQQRLADQKRWYDEFRRQQEKLQLEKRRQLAINRQRAREQQAADVAHHSDVITLSSDNDDNDDDDGDEESCTRPATSRLIKQESWGLCEEEENMAAAAAQSPAVSCVPAAEPPLATVDSSDDDIQLLSSGDEQPPSPPEDVNNAGAHTDDSCNVADASGRVLVNVGHPPTEHDIFLPPQIARNIKPHQIGGVRFLYDNLIESLDRCKNTPGFGCILAHSMGLGKTMQTVTFTDIFLRYTSHRLVLIIVPINTIQNWVNEFNFWMPPADCYTPLALDPTTSPHCDAQAVPADVEAVLASCTAASHSVTSDSAGLTASADSIMTAVTEDAGGGTAACGSDNAASTVSADCGVNNTASTDINDSVNTAVDSDSVHANSAGGVTVEAGADNTDDTTAHSHADCPVTDARAQHRDEGDPVTGVRHRSFHVSVLSELHRTVHARARVIQEWQKNGGVLLMGYEMYRVLNLSSQRSSSRKKKKRSTTTGSSSCSASSCVDDVYTEQREKLLSENIKSALCRPGPDLIICDEGHRIKNAGASISQALKSIRTRRRLALTGYPLQNNLLEYWCMVDFVRPNFLGNKAEFTNMFERPISNGQCSDSTAADVRLMRFRAHVLHSLLEGLVQRRSQAILEAVLPKKEEYVCFLRMTTVQRTLYKRFLTDLLSRATHTPNPLRAFVVGCKIWNHPDILYNLVRRKLVDVDLELEDGGTAADTSSGAGKTRRSSASRGATVQESCDVTATAESSGSVTGDLQQQQHAESDSHIAPSEQQRSSREDNAINYDWAQELLQSYIPGLLETSSKMMVFKILLDESVLLGDKMLLFSQSLFTLNIIEEFLQQWHVPGQQAKWTPHKSYFRLDGSTSGLERERLIHEFNTAGATVPLFLVSTRAGSLGVNLVGANRVLVFDASWNPCHDTQAVCRVYRFGQQKQCYVYRLVTDNCMERRIYDRQVKKQSMSNRIVDETNPENMVSATSLSRLLDPDDEDPAECDVVIDEHSYNDPVLRQVLQHHSGLFTVAPFEHDAQLVDRQDKRLTQAEKRLAKRGYELEKKASASGGITRAGTGRQMTSAIGMYRGMYSKPVANVRPMMSGGRVMGGGNISHQLSTSRYSAEQLARQGVTMTHINVPKDVSIPTGSGQGEPIMLRRGQTVLVIKTAKGVYLRLQDGRIIAIRVPPGSDASSTGVPHFLGGGRTAPVNVARAPRASLNTRAASVSLVGGARGSRASARAGDVIRLPRSITVERVPATEDQDAGLFEDQDDLALRQSQSFSRRTAPVSRVIRPVRHVTVGRGVKRVVVPSRAAAASTGVGQAVPRAPSQPTVAGGGGSSRVKVLVKPSNSNTTPVSSSMATFSSNLSSPRGKVQLDKSPTPAACVAVKSTSVPACVSSSSVMDVATTSSVISTSTTSTPHWSPHMTDSVSSAVSAISGAAPYLSDSESSQRAITTPASSTSLPASSHLTSSHGTWSSSPLQSSGIMSAAPPTDMFEQQALTHPVSHTSASSYVAPPVSSWCSSLQQQHSVAARDTAPDTRLSHAPAPVVSSAVDYVMPSSLGFSSSSSLSQQPAPPCWPSSVSAVTCSSGSLMHNSLLDHVFSGHSALTSHLGQHSLSASVDPARPLTDWSMESAAAWKPSLAAPVPAVHAAAATSALNSHVLPSSLAHLQFSAAAAQQQQQQRLSSTSTASLQEQMLDARHDNSLQHHQLSPFLQSAGDSVMSPLMSTSSSSLSARLPSSSYLPSSGVSELCVDPSWPLAARYNHHHRVSMTGGSAVAAVPAYPTAHPFLPSPSYQPSHYPAPPQSQVPAYLGYRQSVPSALTYSSSSVPAASSLQHYGSPATAAVDYRAGQMPTHAATPFNLSRQQQQQQQQQQMMFGGNPAPGLFPTDSGVVPSPFPHQ